MHPALGAEIAVGVAAGDFNRGALDAGLFARCDAEQIGGAAVALGPTQVHAQQHLGPVLRLGSACAGMDRDDGAKPIAFTAE